MRKLAAKAVSKGNSAAQAAARRAARWPPLATTPLPRRVRDAFVVEAVIEDIDAQ